MIAPATIRITCKGCNKSGYASDFTSCDKEECKLMGKKNRNPKPPALLTGNKPRHHRHCVCSECLEVDTKTVEAALLQAGVKVTIKEQTHQRVKLRVRHFESKVLDDLNDGDDDDQVFVEAPTALCTQIITLGKHK